MQRPIRVLALTALLVPTAACSLEGQATGASALTHDAEAATGSRRDGGLDAAREASLPPEPEEDAQPTEAEPDASRVDELIADAGAAPDAASSCSVGGSYAAVFDFHVAWASSTLGGIFPVLQAGEGNIRLFATVRLDALGIAVMKPCGVTVPDFSGTLLVGGELYGGDVPAWAWDAPTMPTFVTHWSATCDGTRCDYLADQVTFLIGARKVGTGAWPENGAWSAASQYEATDDDNDGFPGLTLLTRGPPTTTAEGKPYSHPPVGLIDSGRSRKLRLAMSFRANVAGVAETCGSVSGESTPSELHVSAVGCTRQTDTSEELVCSPSVAQFVDANLPKWTLTKTTFKMVRMDAAESCYGARTLLAEP